MIAALVFSAMYFLVAIPRVFYPYDLDFLEDSLLMQSLRVAEGQPVFVPLNADFVPHVYMPLYTWLGGLSFKVTGPSFVPLRLLSLGATLATALLIYWIARRESGLRWIAIACAGLWLGGYRITGGWYELVRVDSLFVALALGGLVLGAYAVDPNRRLIGSACMLALAFLTKQTGVIFAIGLAIYLLITIGRRTWLFVMVYGVLTIPPVVILNT
ncbi:MAG: glycosyltransferase family 39 protein, partial [Longimicrobiales bacterium]